jgi:hypothetical protein
LPISAMPCALSREYILAHAYAQCRSNKGAPGVDGQDFADIEAYGLTLRMSSDAAFSVGDCTGYVICIVMGQP